MLTKPTHTKSPPSNNNCTDNTVHNENETTTKNTKQTPKQITFKDPSQPTINKYLFTKPKNVHQQKNIDIVSQDLQLSESTSTDEEPENKKARNPHQNNYKMSYTTPRNSATQKETANPTINQQNLPIMNPRLNRAFQSELRRQRYQKTNNPFPHQYDSESDLESTQEAFLNTQKISHMNKEINFDIQKWMRE